MRAVTADDLDPVDHVAVEVRARRTALQMSIAELARRAGVSAAFISQVEAGRSSVSIPTLYRVATALGCTANTLLGNSDPRPHVTRAGAGPRLTAGSGEHSQLPRLLSRTGDDVRLESYHYVIEPGDDDQEWFQHTGEDFVYVITGSIAIEFDDGSTIELSAGDSLHHLGTIGHRWVLRGGTPAEVLCVVDQTG
jgi:transcriptional regulator with XRE-family HTH domain